MRKIGVGVALLLALVLSAAPALAKGPYFGGQAGVVLLSDSDISNPGGTLTAEFDTGWGLGLVGGYGFDMFRLEGELFYKTNSFDKLSVPGDSISVGGDMTAMGLMLNAYYDFKTGTPFTPYIGAGLGYAQVSIKDLDVPGFGVIADDDDMVFAYQLIAGVGYSVSKAVTLDLTYKYFATADPEFNFTTSIPFDSEYSSHNVMVGLRYNF